LPIRFVIKNRTSECARLLTQRTIAVSLVFSDAFLLEPPMIVGCMKSQPIWIFLILLLLSATVQAAAPETPPWRWKGGFWRISLLSDYAMTSANYTDTPGSYASLDNGGSLTAYEFRPRVRFNTSDSFSLFGGVGGADVTATRLGVKRENSEFSEVYGGADWVIWKKWMRVLLEGEYSYPITPVDINTNQTLTSDGVMWGRVQIYGFKSFSWLGTYFHFGALIPDQGLARTFLYGVGAEAPLADGGLLFGAAFEGEEVLVGDQTIASDRTVVSDRVDGGSHYFYTYNPASLSARTWIGYSPEPAWQVKIGYDRVINGTHVAVTDTFFLLLSFNFDTHPDRENFELDQPVQPPPLTPNQRAVRDFKPNYEADHPELFKNPKSQAPRSQNNNTH
jgi:hypothetical protein